MAARRSTQAKPRCLRRLFGKSKYDLSFLCPDKLEYSSIDKMAKYDWNTFRNYVAFLAGEMASWTMHPHHDSELISWYHDAFLPWDHYLNNIALSYHDSPITRSHFMDPTDRTIRGFYCIYIHWELEYWKQTFLLFTAVQFWVWHLLLCLLCHLYRAWSYMAY